MARALEDRLRIIRLFDTYGGLLTLRQQRLMRLYYLGDLSLGEISEHLRITRQAVRDSLQRAIGELTRFEKHLHLVHRQQASGERV